MGKDGTIKSCFISYCHENIDRPTLDHIIHIIRGNLGREAEGLFDMRLHYTDDFSKLMALLEKVDAVANCLNIFLSPMGARLQSSSGVELTSKARRYVECCTLRQSSVWGKWRNAPGKTGLIASLVEL